MRRKLAAVLAVLAGCTRADPPPEAPRRDDSFAFNATAIDMSLPDVDALGYDIALAVAGPPGSEAFGADVKGTYVATRELTELALDFDGHAIDDVRIDDQPARHRRDGTRLVITLPSPKLAGQRITSRVRYHGVVGQADKVNQNDLTTFGGLYVREQNLEKRRIFSTLGWPSSSRRWLPLRDHPRDGAMVVMTLTFPSPLTVVANGRNTSFVNNGNGSSTWRYEALTPMPPYDLHVSAYDHWQLATAPGSSGVPINTYVYVGSKGVRENVFGDVPKALAYYEKTFGKYRWNTATFIEEPIFGGGMENASVVSMDESLFAHPDDARRIAIHELGHHWSGNLVRIRTWNDFWLSEGFTEYLAGRFRADQGETSVWRDYRVKALAADEKKNHPIVPDGEIDVLSIFDDISYQKGALVLRQLERIVGEETLTKFLAVWFERHAFAAVTTADFERELAAESGRDLGPFFASFVHAASHPELRVSFAVLPNGDVDVKVDQTQTKGPPGGFVFPLDLDLLDASGRAERVVMQMTGKSASKHMHPARTPVSLRIDPDGYFLGTSTCSKGGPVANRDAAAESLCLPQ